MNPQDTNQGEPTPAVTPEQPVAPAPVAPTPAQGNGPDKKLIKLISIIGGVVALIVIAVIVLLATMSVSKEDYKNAYESASDLRSAYSKMSSATYLSSNATETERDNALDTLKETKAKFDEEFTALEGEKAVKNDGEAAELFKALKEKKVKFDAAINSTTEAYEYIIRPLTEMNEVSALRDTSGLDKVISAFNDAKDKLNDTTNKEFVNKTLPLLEEYKKAGDAYIEGMKDRSKYDSNLYTRYSKASRDVTNAIRDWQSTFRKNLNDAEIKNEFNKLGEYLAEKASGK